MPNLVLVLLSTLVALSLLLILALVLILMKSQDRTSQLLQNLLARQVVENQKLRNQLIAPDVQTLAGLNEVMLPSSEAKTPDLDFNLDEDLGEVINYEQRLMQEGLSLGDLGDLESAGWNPPVVRQRGEESVAYDVS